MTTPAPRLRRALRGRAPGTTHERELWERGLSVVAGVDEVGRGAWAGPLTVGIVVVCPERRLYKIRDSKMLTPVERRTMAERIRRWAPASAVGHATAAECDELGMSDAQRLAARRALDALGTPVDHLLVDGNWDFVGGGVPVTTLVKGDTRSVGIAAASIVAKVARDEIMTRFDAVYPGYAFAANKGYPCPRHKAALAARGPSAIHRRRWAFMDDLRWSGVDRPADPEAVVSLFDAAGSALALGRGADPPSPAVGR